MKTHQNGQGQACVILSFLCSVAVYNGLQKSCKIGRKGNRKQRSTPPSASVYRSSNMVNGRGFSSHLRNSSSLTTRFILRKPSPSTISLYIIFLFAFSFFLFLFNTTSVLNDDPKPGFSETYLFQNQTGVQARSQSDSQPESHPVQLADGQLWIAQPSHGLHSCLKPTAKYRAGQGFDHYITVKANGGLNQMRTGIADMVAVAYIMNATLVIPQLDKRSFWQDSSKFSDVFDERRFITTLKDDVRIVKELPQELESIPRARKHFTSWSGVGYYEQMKQLWKDYQVLHVAKSDSRLANNGLPVDIQRLRCRALYQALCFSPPIESLGKKLVERLRSRGGRYIALHLRYEKDMLSFTGCSYGLTEAESEELKTMRENTNHWKRKMINATEERMGGFCPLTPTEVGIFLQALGYPPSTLIYMASGEIYGGESRLLELRSRFPNVVVKETLATSEELKAFANHASQTAALDYIISVESDVFVPSYSGNMARAVEGHRRLLGHRKTITPDRKGLVKLFDRLDGGKMEEGPSFSHLVQEMHKNRQGAPRKRKGPSPGIKGKDRFKTEESFYENPFPECICRSKEAL